MEYIPNTLAEIVTYNLNEQSALTLVYNLLLCIKYLGSANILHRDLKPANILVTSECTIKICDFGLARSLEVPKSKSKADRKIRPMSPVAFTRFYRPPEVILGRTDYGQSADMWSLGCIISELVQSILKQNNDVRKTGQVLFQGKHCFPQSPKLNDNGEGVVDSQEQLIKILAIIGNDVVLDRSSF